jgi:oligopeptide transport system substrate-binding protein
MPVNKKWIVVSLVTIVVMLISACSPAVATPAAPAQPTEASVQATAAPAEPTASEVPPTPAEPKILRLSDGASDIPTLDPSLSDQTSSIQFIESTLLGLVRQNETTANMELSFAKSYDISADGKTITFKLMENVPWVHFNATSGKVEEVNGCDGKPRMVSAEDFRYGLLRTLAPATASSYAYVMSGIAGASEYNGSTETDPAKLTALADAVGVKAIDANTISYTFKDAGVFNLNLIGLWVNHAQPKWLIEGDTCTTAATDKWTEQENFQGYGPFTLKEWVHDASRTLIKNPFWPGTDLVPQAKIDEIQYRNMEETAALAEFEAGNLDTAGIPTSDFDRITSDPQYKDMIRQVLEIGTEWYGFNYQKAPTNDVRVRRALSLAIDRDSLVKNVLKADIPAVFFTNPGATGAPKPGQYPNLDLKYDPAQAKALLADYLKEKGLTADKLKISLMSSAQESRKIYGQAIVGMWKDVLGIDVTFTTQETKVYNVTRKEGNENIYRASWVQDYPDANNFLNDTFGAGQAFAALVDWPVNLTSAGGTPYKPGSNANYDKFTGLLNQASLEKDPAKRVDLYSQAEKILIWDECVLAPIYWYSAPVLLRPEVKDTVSITGYDHYEKWDIQR